MATRASTPMAIRRRLRIGPRSVNGREARLAVIRMNLGYSRHRILRVIASFLAFRKIAAPWFHPNDENLSFHPTKQKPASWGPGRWGPRMVASTGLPGFETNQV